MKFNWGWRVWLLIIVIAFAILAIGPNFSKKVVVLSVERNSTAFNEGLRAGEIIIEINGQKIETKEDYYKVIDSISLINGTQRVDIKTIKNSYIIFSDQYLNITVGDVPSTKIRTGLDLSGGARALVQPEGNITDKEFDDLIQVSRNRFNVFGISDVQIKKQTGFSGEKYMLVEVAGATPVDLQELVSQQGKFEAKIGNATVFEGGKKDISDVCRSGTCSGIESCNPDQSRGYSCQFRFTLYLTEDAAKRHAAITENITVDETGQYLSEKLYLYVDDNEVDSLLVGVDLRGQVTTQISIQGPGTGATEEEAYKDAKENMKKLQTVLITGSLPYKLNIVKLDTISPNLGTQFSYLIIFAAAASLVAVSIIIFARYRKVKASLALLFTSFSEIIIILGVASFINWNLDLPSIAGILATIGTGVDSQIVILDEARRNLHTNLREKIKRALFIILAAYATAAASLLPLGWAGAGLLKGFAITTFIGITAGVFISRPAFAEMIRKIEGQ
ncbi:MAG: PDZ domain-containing protein [Nanoarchaeota archaeon]